MTEKEFSKLTRQELLKLMLMQAQEQTQLEEQMTELAEQMHELEQGHKKLKQSMNDKEKQIAELKESLDEKTGQIETLKESQLVYEDQNKKLAALYAEQNAQNEKMTGYLKDKDNKIRELEDTLERERTVREIKISEAGSIAEAALRLNGVFEAAQKAVDLYIANIALRTQGSETEIEAIRQKMIYEEKNREAENKAAKTENKTMKTENKATKTGSADLGRTDAGAMIDTLKLRVSEAGRNIRKDIKRRRDK